MTEGNKRLNERIIAKITYITQNPTRVFGRIFSKSAIISKLLYDCYCAIPRLIYSCFCIIPLKNKKIVLCNFVSIGGYGDNPKYIAEELIKQNEDYELTWLVGKKHLHDLNFPKEIRKVKYGSIRSFYELATAKIWIDNQRKNSTIWKRNGQFYIQTWHGGYLLKKMSDGEDSLINPAQLDMIRHDCKMTDIVLSNSQTFSEAYRSGYNYSGEIFEVGFPRNDILFQSAEIILLLKQKILCKLSQNNKIDLNTNILIYAPTYRSTFRPEVYNLDYKRVLETLKMRFGGDWVCFVRLHPLVASMANTLGLDVQNVYDVSDYPDAQELLCIGDVLITDYSSIIFDFVLPKKLGILLTPDLSTYKKPQEYGLAVNVDDLPFLHANTNQELFELLLSYNHEDYLVRLNKFFEDSKGFDNGFASLKCINRIKDHCYCK